MATGPGLRAIRQNFKTHRLGQANFYHEVNIMIPEATLDRLIAALRDRLIALQADREALKVRLGRGSDVVHEGFDVPTIERILQRLVDSGQCILLRGLTDQEICGLQAKFRFQFPPEMSAMLRVGVPVEPGKTVGVGSAARVVPGGVGSAFGWHNWIQLLSDDVCVGVPANDHDEVSVEKAKHDTIGNQLRWHAPPDSDDPIDAQGNPLGPDALSKRADALVRYPLVPVYAHRMMPTVPSCSGLPVWSMHGNDCISYGDNFWDWLVNEFDRDGKIGLRQEIPQAWLASAVEEQLVPHWPQFID
jgi:hypothetical protein